MAQHRLTALALAGVLALGVSGCGDDTPPETAPSTTPASASPSATASGPVAPVLPELAKREDAVGAKAFVEYWFAAANFAIETGDVVAVKEVSSSDCGSCTSLIRSIRGAYAEGGRISGGRLEVVAIEHDPRLEDPLYRFAVKLKQRPKKVLDSDGSLLKQELGATGQFFAAVRKARGDFEFLGLERVDD